MSSTSKAIACPQDGDFFLGWWPDISVPRIVRPIGPGADVYEVFWSGGEYQKGHPERWTPLPANPVPNHTAEDLLKRAVLQSRNHKRKTEPLWAGVMHVFGLGSTYAKELCRWAGLDPEERTVKP